MGRFRTFRRLAALVIGLAPVLLAPAIPAAAAGDAAWASAPPQLGVPIQPVGQVQVGLATPGKHQGSAARAYKPFMAVNPAAHRKA